MAVPACNRPYRLNWIERRLWVEDRPLHQAHNRSPFVEEEFVMEAHNSSTARRVPWNKGRLSGQKPPLKLREIWAIRTRLQMASNARELAMFNLAIDSKLRACDWTPMQVQDVCIGGHAVPRATFMQQKTQRPVEFEIAEQTWQSVARCARHCLTQPDGAGRGQPRPATQQNPQARVGAIAARGRSVAMIRYMPPPISTPKNQP
jgi:hypothetical protein